MASRREQVIEALVARLAAALPGAEVKRNLAKAERIPAGGLVIVRDGDPGEPEVTLSPLTYLYAHRIPLEIAVQETGAGGREHTLDTMLRAVGNAIASDRTLGGLCDFLEAEAPASGDIETAGALPGRWAEAAIVAHYGTPDPLN